MKSCLARARTSNDQNIFVDIVLGIFVSAHHDPLSLSEQNILVKLGVNEGLYIIGVAPGVIYKRFRIKGENRQGHLGIALNKETLNGGTLEQKP